MALGRLPVEEELDGAVTLLGDRLPDRGQLGRQGGVDAVETGDRDVARHVAAGPGELVDDGQGRGSR